MNSLFDTPEAPAAYIPDAEVDRKKGRESARLTRAHIERTWSEPKKATSGINDGLFEEIAAIAPDRKGQTSLF